MRNATRAAFTNLIDLAIREAVAFVLLVGDLYDGDWKDYRTGLYFTREMARLNAAGIHVYMLQGNHDAESQISKNLNLPANVRRFTTNKPQSFRIEELDVVIVGQGFKTRAVSENLCANYPQAKSGVFTIGMLHTSVDGREGHDPYAPCSLSDLVSRGYDYFALGHVHNREVLSQDPWVVFPGNIQGRHIRETGQKGCTLVEVEDGRILTVEHRSVDVARWVRCQIDAASVETTNELLALIEARLKTEIAAAEGLPLAARIIIQGSSAVHNTLLSDEARWKSEIRNVAVSFTDGAVWIEKIRFETRLPKSSTGSESGENPSQDGDNGLGQGGQDDIMRSIEEIKLDSDLLKSLQAEFEDLHRKLPGVLREGPDGIQLNEGDPYADLLKDAKEHLLSRLTNAGNYK